MSRVQTLISIVAIVTFVAFSALSQQFEGKVIAGINASQIRGDEMAGFNKIGLSAGLGVAYPLRERLLLNVDLLFSERGSKNELIPGQAFEPIAFYLQYASVPIYVSFKDWAFEFYGEPYYKLRFDAGFSYGRLLTASVNNFNPGQNPDVDALIDAYRKNDLSWQVGFGLMFNPDWGFQFRYNRSFYPIFNPNKQGRVYSRSLLPFFLTFQLFHRI